MTHTNDWIDLKVDFEKHTIMGVEFPESTNLESLSSAMYSATWEGFKPTISHITILRDYYAGKISRDDLRKAISELYNA
ncbi:MAG: antitoxin VbhA family protein [Holophagaceae bacterium]|nr:antitoxin VbhA family protein [Holophagaceae bacterium]